MSHETEILKLASENEGKAATFFAKGLKTIGGGRMAGEIENIVAYSTHAGIAIGEKQGVKKGVALGAHSVLTVGTAVKCGQLSGKRKAVQERILRRIRQDKDVAAMNSKTDLIADEVIEKMSTQVEETTVGQKMENE